MQIQKIRSLLKKINPELVVLLCHHNADPDAICAAYAFSQLLKRLNPQLEVEIASPTGPSKLTKSLLNSLAIEITEQPQLEDSDLIVLLDTNNIQQLNEWREIIKRTTTPIIVIDHHASHPETEILASMRLINENASSTCEIVYNLYRELNISFRETEAKALFLGIAYDTRHFILADSNTFKAIVQLVDAGVDPKETLSLLSLPMDSSERVARIKACQRAEFERVGVWLIALSYVGAYQASAARALISLGAHVAVVGGKNKTVLSLSLRSHRDFYKKTGIHLGRDIATPLGEHINGMGGGHSLSAGVNGFGDEKASLKQCLKILKEKIENSFLSNYS